MADVEVRPGQPVTGEVTEVDVAVVGAGPAGLAAALTCARAGLTVCLIDRGTGIGGQYWRQPGESPVLSGVPGPQAGRGAVVASDLRHLHHDAATFESLRDRLTEAVRAGLVDLRLRTQVWTAVRAAGAEAIRSAGAASDRTDALDLHVLGTGPDTGARGARGARDVAGVVRASRVVLATGAHDIGLPFPGWDLPGVMTIGGIQALLKGSDVVPGQRVALGGTGPFLLPVATALATRGVEVAGVFEANPPTAWWPHLATVARHPARLREGLAYAAVLARHRVRYRPRTMIVEAHGRDRVEAVSVRRLDRAGQLQPGTAERLAVDAVGVGWGFSPILDLAVTLGCATRPGDNGFAVVAVDAEQRSSVPGVLVVGEPTGVGGAALALAEGELAGHVVVSDLADLTDPAPVAGPGHSTRLPGLTTRPRDAAARRRAVRRDVVRLRAFASAMHAAHPVPPGWVAAVRPDTVVCRCEEVDAATVLAAIASGADTARQVKQLTRAGMGWCQGRTCEPACALLAAGAGRPAAHEGAPAADPARMPTLGGDTERLVAQPVSLGALADLLGRTTPPQDPQ